ncbi:hypothetical protein DFQ09_101523 [Winogradskyella pacifica]|uniref:Uncharacterized protein n=1 Tax=Winogradskyella pacifica TaxID=664642 RepID=A0A3D9N4H1_9FLAO|nr:hypothetical protein DFQ09_101523 [Winogradskyella pacifica]
MKYVEKLTNKKADSKNEIETALLELIDPLNLFFNKIEI